MGFVFYSRKCYFCVTCRVFMLIFVLLLIAAMIAASIAVAVFAGQDYYASLAAAAAAADGAS